MDRYVYMAAYLNGNLFYYSRAQERSGHWTQKLAEAKVFTNTQARQIKAPFRTVVPNAVKGFVKLGEATIP